MRFSGWWRIGLSGWKGGIGRCMMLTYQGRSSLLPYGCSFHSHFLVLKWCHPPLHSCPHSTSVSVTIRSSCITLFITYHKTLTLYLASLKFGDSCNDLLPLFTNTSSRFASLRVITSSKIIKNLSSRVNKKRLRSSRG